MKKVTDLSKRVVATALTTAMTMSVAACGSEGTNDQTDVAVSDESAQAKEESGNNDNTTGEVVELTVHGIYNGSVTDYTLPVISIIQENVGVHLTNTVASTTTDDDQVWTLMMSSPDTMPDIIVSPSMEKMEKLGADGGLIALEDYLDEYAPNIVAAFEKYPELKSASTASDGHIYEICGMKEMSSSFTYVIRQDWLDALNIEMPDTVNELHDVLYAFATEDPNGNGQKDEIPVYSRWGSDGSFTDQMLGLWDSGVGLMVREGQVVFDPLEDNFKVGMSNLIEWYAEGLIDPEVYTREDARNVLLGENKGGFTIDWPASTTGYNSSLAEQISGFNNVVMGVPADQNGNRYMKYKSVPYAGVGISTNCQNIEAALKLIDYMYSEEGQILLTYGIEGETYTVNEDGTYEFTEEAKNTEGGVTAARDQIGCINWLGGIDPVELELAIATNQETLDGYTMYAEHTEWYPTDQYANYNFKYTAEELQEINNLLPGIKTFVQEKCMSWILGNGNFENEYDSFVEELKSRGIDRVIEISQQAYSRVQ